jgi:hypothetical protein
MKDPYMQCYLAGRYDVFEGDVDLEKLAEDSMAVGASIRAVTAAAAKKEIDAEMDPATKIAWLKDNLEEIKAMGGDDTKAYRQYVQGRVDGLAHQLEADVINMIEDMNDEDEEPEDEDDDETDEDEDEEDGDEG